MILVDRAIEEMREDEKIRRVRKVLGVRVREESTEARHLMRYSKRLYRREKGRTVPSGLSYHLHMLYVYTNKI